MLDENYVPHGGGPPRPPLYPTRLRCMIYAFALTADEEASKRGV